MVFPSLFYYTIFVTHQLYIISDYDILLEINNDGGGRYESRSEN